jgi:protein O-mannosyl-transferase
VALGLAALAAYVPALPGGFLWDEDVEIAANPLLTEPGGLGRIWTVGEATQFYPLTFTSWWVERRLWGLDTRPYHLANVALHLLNALLVWALLAEWGFSWAWLAAALFALHPVHAETVAWIMERKNLLSAFFSLLAWLAYERKRPAAALAAFVLALLSKTTACTLPVLMLVARWGRGKKVELAPLLPFFAAGAALAGVTVWVEAQRAGTGGLDFMLSPVQRLLIAGRALWFYAAKLAWPQPLCFNYARWTPDPRAAWQWLFPAAFVVLALALRRRRALAACAAFFAVALSPALGFFNVYPMRYSFVADHFQYFASLGLIVPFAALVPRRAGLLLLPVLGFLTWQRAHAFASPEKLWLDTLDKNPASFLALENEGLILQNRGHSDAAAELYRRALALKPDLIEARNNLANILASHGLLDEAIAELRMTLRVQPSYAEAHNNLGLALARKGDLKGSLAEYARAIALKPGLTGARYNAGLAYERLGRRAEARAQFEEVARQRPDFAPARQKLLRYSER